MNVGLGLSYLLNPDITGFVAIRTDFSYVDSSRYSDPSDGYVSDTSHYDIYHLQVGGNVKDENSTSVPVYCWTISAGLMFAYIHNL